MCLYPLTAQTNYPFSYAKKKVFVYARETVSQEKPILMRNTTKVENKKRTVSYSEYTYII